MEVSAECRWGRCSNSTEHVVAHPILGMVEVCRDCMERWEQEGECIADVVLVEETETALVRVLDSRRWELAVAARK